jgi:hypothetical protein
MLAELSSLLAASPAKASRGDYVRALVEENCLGKHTLSTRKLTLQRLSELYGLEPSISIFRLLRIYWGNEDRAHAQLAVLAALARDPLLRATAPVILGMSEGEEMARQRLTVAVREAVEGRLNEATLDKVVRNAASSWTQSGHLEGRGRKRRRKSQPTAGAVAFALLLGYMLGARGQALFGSLFARALDRDEGALTFLAMDARRLGFLDMKTSGGLTVVSFDGILTEQEKKVIHGAD